MDGVMGGEARELPVRGLAVVLALLLGILLVADQTFWVKIDRFLDSRLIPSAGIREDVFGKVGERIFSREDEGIEHEACLLLETAAIPRDVGLLLKDAAPAPVASEHVLAEYTPGGKEAAALQPDTSEAVQAGGTGPIPMEPVFFAAMMPAPEEPAVAAPEHMPDTTVAVEEIVSEITETEESVPESPAGIAAEETVEKELEEPPVTEAKQQPEMRATTETAAPAPVETEKIITEKPAEEEPVQPEPIVPDTEAAGSETADDAASDDAGTQEEEAEPVSCLLLDEAGMLCGFLPEYADGSGYLALPPECTGIRSGAFSGCGAGILELYIPAGAATVEAGAFCGLDDLEWIEVEGGNPGYASVSGVLFDSSMTVLMKFPSGRVGTYLVPPNVAMIADGAFEGASISKMDLRNCPGLLLYESAFGSSAGSGIEVLTPEAQF